jgi:bifunctional DNA-binding transcriptional regulator/antitoxin component of YhaV-PrlF toxin-antitoxin module
MKKIIQLSDRGQITIPQKWRKQLNTQFFNVTLENGKLILSPLKELPNFEESLNNSWQEYLDGQFTSLDELKAKYDL